MEWCERMERARHRGCKIGDEKGECARHRGCEVEGRGEARRSQSLARHQLTHVAVAKVGFAPMWRARPADVYTEASAGAQGAQGGRDAAKDTK